MLAMTTLYETEYHNDCEEGWGVDRRSWEVSDGGDGVCRGREEAVGVHGGIWEVEGGDRVGEVVTGVRKDR